MTVELIGIWPKPHQEALAKLVQAIDGSRELDLPQGAINLKLVDDAEISALNEQYSGNAYATDVLTFTYDDDDGELADVVISTDTAAAQAKQAGIGLSDEIALLALHGILHTLGFDHGDDASQQELEQLQQVIMERAKLPYRKFEWKH